MKREILLFITITAISCFIFLPFVSSLEFNLDFPSKVYQEEEFNVLLSTSEDVKENYDVKIFVNKHTKEYSEVFFNDKWQSPFNYLPEAFPENKEFKLRAHLEGETQLCAKLRDSSEKVFSKCEDVSVLKKDTEIVKNSEEKIEPEQEEKTKKEQNEEVKEVFVQKNVQNISLAYSDKPEEKIRLKQEKYVENKILYEDKSFKNLNIILNVVLGFILLILFLFLFKKH